MLAVYFFYGAAFFAMGLAVALEARRSSELVLSRHLPWLAAFGLVHSAVEWCDMFMMVYLDGAPHGFLTGARMILLPLSALCLIRFGVGLVSEAGPLPEWLAFVPVALLVPLAFLVAYALTVAASGGMLKIATDVWSRYLLYFPGCLLAVFGFVRQWRGLSRGGIVQARRLMFGAAVAFLFNGIAAGLVVPTAPYGLAPWVNYESVRQLTGLPVQMWRALSAIAVAFFVVRALDVFEVEREQQLHALQLEHERDQTTALSAQRAEREIAENWTEGLVSISRRVADLENVEDVLGATVSLARKLLSSDLAALGLWNEDQSRLELKCLATAQGARHENLPTQTHPLIIEALRAHQAMRFPEDAPTAQEPWSCAMLGQKIHAVACVPLQLENQVLGGLWIGRVSPASFTPTDLIGLERLADQAVIALEHAAMTARLQSLAVTEERSRIAREMHDGLLQILGYLNLEMQTIEAFTRQGDLDSIRAELTKTRASINAAQADVRENVLSLRTTLAGDTGLIVALRDYIEEFGVQTSIQVQFVDQIQEPPRLSPLAEAQLVRIVQEALANVRKHAQASHVQVRLSKRHHAIQIGITDNGVGFQATTVKDHFGLQTMRERAESIHGVLTINSEIGIGTRVNLVLPVLES
ncbi:MAG: GAF domain-containing sensor histidine kinase [Chloroflexi bacterium]|nr:GAF domain-containing sensor histidine kinase [Chloroflexota bacterium]